MYYIHSRQFYVEYLKRPITVIILSANAARCLWQKI